MISRVAGICFWMSRYLERVENTIRVLTANYTYMLDGEPVMKDAWWSVVCVMGVEKEFEALYSQQDKNQEELIQKFLVWDDNNPVSIKNSLHIARENAKIIRDSINNELWDTINRLWLWFISSEAEVLYSRNKYLFCVTIQEKCQSYQGVLHNSIPRTSPYEFMRLGFLLERASQTTRILDINYHCVSDKSAVVDETAQEIAHWLNLLESCGAHEIFMMYDHAELIGSVIAKFLTLNQTFPRSILFCLERAHESLLHIQASAHSQIGNNTRYKLEEVIAALKLKPIDKILKNELHSLLNEILENTDEICETLAADFFEPQRTIDAIEETMGGGQQ